MVNFQKKTLNNGLRVIAVPMKNTSAATLLVLVGIGSRYETKKINGVSHFLEHLFFKGTKSRPRLGQIHKELDKMGATHNAFTTKESTGFWVKSSAKDFGAGLDIVSDILLEPLFKKEEIEKEKGVILQEISMREDEPSSRVWEILENILYKDRPVGWDIAGTKESVGNMKRSGIVDYRNRNYLSKNMIVVAAGNIESEITFEKIEKYFRKIKKGKNKPSKKTRIFQKSPQIKIIKKDSDQTHLALGIRAYDMYDEKRYALNLLSVILGGNFSSRIVTEIREKLGLAYYVFAFGDQYTDCGYLGIGAGVAHKELERVVKKISAILRALRSRGVSKKDLRDAKSFIRGQMALKLETSDEVAGFCASQELFYNKILQPDDILKNIEKVSQNDIIKVAREILRPNKISLAVIGNQDNKRQKELLLKNIKCLK